MEKLYKILKLLIWILAFAVVITGAYVLYNSLSGQVALGGLSGASAQAAEETQAAEKAAPDFTVYDIDGNPHKLSDFLGKPVILNFWASWCGPCKMEMPDLEEAYLKYGDEIRFMLVDLTDGSQETIEKASAFIAEQGYSFPVYYDSGREGAYAYGVTGIPATYFIDENGNFKAYYQGAMSADILQQGIDMLLNQE